MSRILEVLFCCDTSDDKSSCSAWDYRTGTNLMTYRGAGNIQQKCFCLHRNDFLVTANITKPLFHIWPINHHDQITSARFVAPGRVNAMNLSPDGIYLVAAIQENLYIWQLLTGRMMNTISKHYQSINCIRFTSDSSHFVSAGQDGSVLVWNLTKVVSRSDDNQTPVYSFTDHGLPVKDVYISGFGMKAILFTASLDRTCKVYELARGTLLLNIVFGEGLHCVITNPSETNVFVGTSEGHIFEFNLTAPPRTKEYHIENDYKKKFVGHKSGTAVDCIVLSMDGLTLLSGGQDHQVCVWNIPSRHLIKTLAFNGAISNLSLHMLPSDVFNPEKKKSNTFTKHLKRMIDSPETDDNLEIDILVTEESAYNYEQNYERGSHDFLKALMEELGLVNKTITDGTVDNGQQRHSDQGDKSHTNLQSNDSEPEIKKLRQEIEDLKRINTELFAKACEYISKNP